MQVHVVTAGDIANGMDRFDQRRHVGFEIPLALRRSRIAPAHHEHLEFLPHQVLDDALARSEVEHIELVDLWRHDKLRAGVDFGRDRRVLDQFEYVIAEDHRSLRARQILANTKRALVDLGRHALIGQGIGQQVGHSGEQAETARFERLPERRRVAQQHIGRRQRVENEGCEELRALLAARIHDRAADKAGRGIPPRKVAL
ncbi:hypothetical protein D3C85_1170840 [compost metagenome]